MRGRTAQTSWLTESKYFGGAVLIHLVLGVLLVGFNWRSQQAIVPQLAINAVMVDRNMLNQLARQQAKPAPPAPKADPEPKPEPKPDEALQKQKEQELLKQEQLKQEQLKQEQLKQEQLKQEQLKQQQLKQDQARQQQLELQQAQERAAAEAQKKQQQEADKKRLADIQQKQREAEQKRQAEADTKAQAASEAELKAQLAAEEGRANAVNAGLLNQYVALLNQKVMRNWNKPETARSGLECEVKVTQSPGGTVLSVEVGRCNGDAAVKSSIEAAVYRASPLPAPPDPRLFDRNLLFIFKPTE